MATTMFANRSRQASGRPAGGKIQMTREQFLNWLQKADVNGDGQITKQELSRALRQLGLNCGLLRAWGAVHKADLNNNSAIDSDLEIMILMNYAARNWGIVFTDE